jgi:hypothetical protein
MSNIDDRIRNSLSTEDRKFLAELDDAGSLSRDLAAAFRGRMRWLNILGSIMGVVLFILAAYCAWRFFHESSGRGMALWGAGAALAFLGNGLIKLWFWIEIKSNSILREVKRVELQVASLAAAMRNAGPA